VNRLKSDFFEKPAINLAEDLLGKMLVRKTDKGLIKGKIVETEAYVGEEDLACHARFGRTERNKAMYGKGGLVYIYLIYGMYYNFNIVAGAEHVPEAVLIRALEPIEGIKLARENLKNYGRVRADKDILSGPGKLCAALNLDKSFYGEDIASSKKIWLEDIGGAKPVVEKSKRVGIDYADIYADKLWRLSIKGNKFVSK